MATAYFVHIKKTKEENLFTTISALCEKYSKKELGITGEYISLRLRSNPIYENEYFIIKKFQLLTAPDVRRLKGMDC